MSIDEFEKAISNPAQSDKDFQQDTDDGCCSSIRTVCGKP